MGGIEGVCGIANGGDGPQDPTQFDTAWVPTDSGTVAGIVDIRIEHPRQPPQVLFVQPEAGGTADLLQQKLSFPGRPEVPDKGALDLRVVIKGQPTSNLLGDGGRRPRVRDLPVSVVVLQSGLDHGPAHRVASGTTERPLLAEHVE